MSTPPPSAAVSPRSTAATPITYENNYEAADKYIANGILSPFKKGDGSDDVDMVNGHPSSSEVHTSSMTQVRTPTHNQDGGSDDNHMVTGLPSPLEAQTPSISSHQASDDDSDGDWKAALGEPSKKRTSITKASAPMYRTPVDDALGSYKALEPRECFFRALRPPRVSKKRSRPVEAVAYGHAFDNVRRKVPATSSTKLTCSARAPAPGPSSQQQQTRPPVQPVPRPPKPLKQPQQSQDLTDEEQMRYFQAAHLQNRRALQIVAEAPNVTHLDRGSIDKVMRKLKTVPEAPTGPHLNSRSIRQATQRSQTAVEAKRAQDRARGRQRTYERKRGEILAKLHKDEPDKTDSYYRKKTTELLEAWRRNRDLIYENKQREQLTIEDIEGRAEDPDDALQEVEDGSARKVLGDSRVVSVWVVHYSYPMDKLSVADLEGKMVRTDKKFYNQNEANNYASELLNAGSGKNNGQGYIRQVFNYVDDGNFQGQMQRADKKWVLVAVCKEQMHVGKLAPNLQGKKLKKGALDVYRNRYDVWFHSLVPSSYIDAPDEEAESSGGDAAAAGGDAVGNDDNASDAGSVSTIRGPDDLLGNMEVMSDLIQSYTDLREANMTAIEFARTHWKPMPECRDRIDFVIEYRDKIRPGIDAYAAELDLNVDTFNMNFPRPLSEERVKHKRGWNFVKSWVMVKETTLKGPLKIADMFVPDYGRNDGDGEVEDDDDED